MTRSYLSGNLRQNRLGESSKTKENFLFSNSNMKDSADNFNINSSNSSNNFHQKFLKTELKETFTFDEYTSVLNSTMAKYIFNNTANDEKIEELLKIKDLKKNRKSHRISQSLQIPIVLPKIDETFGIRTHARQQNYQNPIESFEKLETNRQIYNELNKNNYDRQEVLYRDTLEKIKNDDKKFSIKMPRIKIVDIMQKKKSYVRNEMSLKNIWKVNLEKNKRKLFDNKTNLSGRASLPFLSTQEIRYYCLYKNTGKIFPEVRDQFSFHGDYSRTFMWGGMNPNKSNNIWSLDTYNLEWTKHTSQNLSPFQRYGHTGLVYFKKLYIVGGRIKENNYTFFPSNIDIYDTEDHTWSSQQVYSRSNLCQRRNHVAEIIGCQMIIHGGINEKNEFLNETVLISFSPLKFIQCVIKEETPGPYLAGHGCALVIPSEMRSNTKFNIYKSYDSIYTKKLQLIVKYLLIID